MDKDFNFESYVKDEMFLFYGVDNLMFKINDDIFEVVEDPDDGYRSYMDTIMKVNGSGIFSHHPLGVVKIIKVDGSLGSDLLEGFHIIDVFDNHVWLEFGTCHYDEYYPGFEFHYYPKGQI